MPETPHAVTGTVLGFDFGLRRIGVAVGQTLTCTANPLCVIGHDKQPDWPEIESLFAQWRPAAVVVGLPLGKDGEETSISKRVRQFGEQLGDRFGVSVYYNDERFTSRVAESRFADLRASGQAKKKDASKLDAMAAGIILESWLNRIT